MLTVATLLRGDARLSRALLASINANFIMLKAGYTPQVVAGSNNPEDDARLTDSGAIVVKVERYFGKDERERIEFVGDLWLRVLDKVKTKHVVLWDDDVIPNQIGLRELKATMEEQDKDVAGVVSVYPFREDSKQAVLFSGEVYMPMMLESIPRYVFQTRGGGMGFSIWDTQKLKSTLPWHVHSLPGGSPSGLDYDVALKLETQSLRTVCNGQIICRHTA